MDHTQLFLRNQEYIKRILVEECVLVPIHQENLETGSIYALNEVGAELWECLANPASIDQLAATLREEYEVENEDDLLQDLRTFLDELEARGALIKVDAA